MGWFVPPAFGRGVAPSMSSSELKVTVRTPSINVVEAPSDLGSAFNAAVAPAKVSIAPSRSVHAVTIVSLSTASPSAAASCPTWCWCGILHMLQRHIAYVAATARWHAHVSVRWQGCAQPRKDTHAVHHLRGGSYQDAFSSAKNQNQKKTKSKIKEQIKMASSLLELLYYTCIKFKPALRTASPWAERSGSGLRAALAEAVITIRSESRSAKGPNTASMLTVCTYLLLEDGWMDGWRDKRERERAR